MKKNHLLRAVVLCCMFVAPTLFCACDKIEDDTTTTGYVTEHMLVYVYSGELETKANGKTKCLHKGQAYLLRRNHKCQKSVRPKEGEGFEGIFIYFKRGFLKKTLTVNNLSLEEAPTAKFNSSFIELPEHHYLDELCSSFRGYFKTAHFPSEQLVNIKMMEAVLTLIEIKPELKAVLFDFTGPMKIDIAEFMEDNYLLDLSLSDLAHYTGRSLSAFKNEFAALFHTSPARWVVKRRLQEAKKRIEELGESPMTAAEKTSFKSYSHFSHAFKKEYRTNPSEIKTHRI